MNFQLYFYPEVDGLKNVIFMEHSSPDGYHSKDIYWYLIAEPQEIPQYLTIPVVVNSVLHSQLKAVAESNSLATSAA